MAISITPTLSSSAGYLTDVRDQVMHFVKFFIMNPGGTSDLWEDRLYSFRYLSSKYDSDRDLFASTLESTVKNFLSIKFRDYNFDCEFSVSDYQKDVKNGLYTIAFKIAIEPMSSTGFESAFITGDITTDKKTNEIKLKFSNTTDTASLE